MIIEEGKGRGDLPKYPVSDWDSELDSTLNSNPTAPRIIRM